MERTPNSPQPDYEPLFSQRVEGITYIPHTPSHNLPSALRSLLELSNARNASEIGLHGPVLAAGSTEHNKHLDELGLYQEIYPRDAHVSSYLLWNQYPKLTRASVLASLPYNGVVDNLHNTNWIDEQETGKVPHQIRDPNHPRSLAQFEIRRRGYPYYGAIDTTQKNVLAIARECFSDPPHSLSFLHESYRDLEGNPRSILEGLDANVDWILGRLSLNPQGILESIQINPRHHGNQSWADSPDAFHHADGSFARHHPEQDWGVASVEVNAEAYDSLLAAARVYETLKSDADGEVRDYLQSRIDDIQAVAAKLKKSIHEYFWVDDVAHHGGYFARGTDRDDNGNLHPLEIRSSDMGHLLLSDVLDGDDPKIISIIQNLFSPEMLAANGIRTLASDSARYDKDAYHNGCVWPWDTYIIVLGLEKRGYYGLARELERRIMEFYRETNTLAEYGSGDDEERINFTKQVTVFDPDLNEEPIYQYSLYNIIQPPQEIQAWTVAAVLAIKHKNGLRALGKSTLPDIATDPKKREIELAVQVFTSNTKRERR